MRQKLQKLEIQTSKSKEIMITIGCKKRERRNRKTDRRDSRRQTLLPSSSTLFPSKFAVDQGPVTKKEKTNNIK